MGCIIENVGPPIRWEFEMPRWEFMFPQWGFKFFQYHTCLGTPPGIPPKARTVFTGGAAAPHSSWPGGIPLCNLRGLGHPKRSLNCFREQNSKFLFG